MSTVLKTLYSISLIMAMPLTAYASPKKPSTVFELLTNSTKNTLWLNCSLKSEIFHKKCKIQSTYLGSTMGDAISVYFPNGKQADYRGENYEDKTLAGLKDDNANYRFTSTPTTLEIFRNEQGWVKLWKNQRQ